MSRFFRWFRTQNLSWAAIGGAVVLISMIRRPDQVQYPEVWVEEGTQFIPQFLERGWMFIFEPVNGYLILPPKICALIAYHLSFVHYPVVSYVLALAVSCTVGIVIFKAPTMLPYKWLAALVPFLIPFDPEPIGIGEYSFWFVGLFSVIGLVWLPRVRPMLRLSLIGLGGLSAPLGVTLVPFFAVRAFATRDRSDAQALLVSALTTAVQMTFVLNSNAVSSNYIGPLLADLDTSLLQIAEKFIASFIWSHEPIALVGVLVLFLFARWTFEDIKQGRFLSLSLLSIAALSIALGVIRVPLADISPMGNGPRYFFYPFVFMGWALLAFGQMKHRSVFVYPMAGLIALNTATFLYRPHDNLDWEGSVERCLQEPGDTDLPVHFTGDAAIAWKVTLSQRECEYMAKISLFE